MNGRLRTVLLALLLVPIVGIPGARAATPLATVRVAQGLSFPLYVTSPPGDTTRLFIVERRGPDNRGRIKVLKSGVILPTPFLTSGPLATGTEQGLLGLAFAPDYATSGRFYINYTDSIGGTTRIERRTVSSNPDVANPTGTVILSIPQPYANHNGGWLGFGPDGYLHVALGDGGSGGDPGDRAQNLNTLLGKVLRLDVSGAGYAIPPGNPYAGSTPGLDEIWSYGLRNPWRSSFDRRTGDFIIGDVGQNQREEVDFAPSAAGAGAGANYGWRCFEGDLPYAPSTTNPCGSCVDPACPMVPPAHDYDHAGGKCSVIGGYVYRGCAIPDLQGTYFFGDWCTGQVWTGKFQADSLAGVTDRTADLAPGAGLSIDNITSFGEDARGEIYICDDDGEVYKIVPGGPILESDMQALRVRTAAGDSVGSTAPGNALLPGVVPFADAGSRIRGAGFLKDATIRDCAVIEGHCLTSYTRVDPFDVELTACVDSINAMLTRRFVFTNTAAGPRDLAYVDVITPRLRGDPDAAVTAAPAGAGGSAVLVQSDASDPDRWIVHSGTGSAGVAYTADVDTASELSAHVAADQPLAGGASAGPGTVGLALGFDFGTVAAAARETVTVVTAVRGSPPSGVEPEPPVRTRGELHVRSAIPVRSELRLEVALFRREQVTLDVFDPAGRRVRTLARGLLPAGRTAERWDGTLGRGIDAPAGVYFLRLGGEGWAVTRKVVLVR